MSLHPHPIEPIPEATAAFARQAFPKGNRYILLRDELGTIYSDEEFTTLFSVCGQSAISPWRLALICVMQFLEDLTDRQAADAVRSRIDWKYLLSLDLGDPGFDFSVLSEFRSRVIAGHLEQWLLERLLEQCKQKGWIKERGKQRTDSTHVLAAIRTLNRLESIGEALRAALNAIATVEPEWLKSWVPSVWFERYGRPVEEYRLPKGKEARQSYAEMIGDDGMELLAQIWSEAAPHYLREIPTVDHLRQTWIHQFWVDNGRLHLREAKDLPPVGKRSDSPYDPEARYGNKRSQSWTGYKVHLSETCDEDAMHLVTNVITSTANVPDIAQTEPTHQALKAKQLLPGVHLVDAGYVDTRLLLDSPKKYGIELIGPTRPNGSWQTKEPEAYDLSQFRINWNTKKVTCPQGKKSKSWTPTQDAWGNPIIYVKFSRTHCRLCPTRTRCTRCATEARSLTLRPKAEHQLLQKMRQQEPTQQWLAKYSQRAGIEGTLSQGIHCFGLRRTRYIGLAKTHLQHVLTSIAMNITRIVSWLLGIPHTRTRISRFAALASDSPLGPI
ncbi:MAG: IS1182 family transposase [Chroococcidiopsidaceae cyanobacterium CP_BM_ER_R8_30]|nr:IS1182 family transposase [Chroococcidiopsidaceae cyanobacterium CP_BM_ER_R8_30]